MNESRLLLERWYAFAIIAQVNAAALIVLVVAALWTTGQSVLIRTSVCVLIDGRRALLPAELAAARSASAPAAAPSPKIIERYQTHWSESHTSQLQWPSGRDWLWEALRAAGVANTTSSTRIQVCGRAHKGRKTLTTRAHLLTSKHASSRPALCHTVALCCKNFH